MTRLIWGMSGAHWQNFSPKASTNADSIAGGPSPDMVTRGTTSLPDIDIASEDNF